MADPVSSSAALVGPGPELGPRTWVAEHGSPLLVLDCDLVRSQYRSLANALPGVDIHYAMKALAHPAVIATLDDEGSFFDLSTTGELGLLRRFGIGADRMIHTHPIKRPRDIRDLFDFGCRTFVVDNAAEMAKFTAYGDKVSLVLRVGFRSPDAVVDLAKKFGCAPEDAFALLELGHRLQIPVRGLSFHVGSQCGSPAGHVVAIDGCFALIDRAHRAGFTPIRILDIGGGFPVSYCAEAPSIEDFCDPIRQALEALQAGEARQARQARVDGQAGVRIIAEPGRFLAAPAMQGIATIVGKAHRRGSFWYYLDDGVYGSYSGRVYDGARYPVTAISRSTGQLNPSVLAGPTCDSVDILAEDIWLPELEIDDLIVVGSMGAYTAASASEFNSIPKTKILVLNGPHLKSFRGTESRWASS